MFPGIRKFRSGSKESLRGALDGNLHGGTRTDRGGHQVVARIHEKSPLPDNEFPPQESEFILDDRWDVSDVEGPAFANLLKKHGLSN